MLRSPSAAGPGDVPIALVTVGVARMDALGVLDAATERLQARDRARLDAIASTKRRRELLAGRWLLQALAVHLDLPPVVFDGAEGGAGVDVRSDTGCAVGLSASVSHAGHWIACAIGAGDGVGVDLEVLVERDFIALAQAAFPADVAVLEALAPDERAVAFYRRWTQHEAVIKRGRGAGRCASWLSPGEWVLSAEGPLAAWPLGRPLLWDESARAFRSLAVEALDRV